MRRVFDYSALSVCDQMRLTELASHTSDVIDTRKLCSPRPLTKLSAMLVTLAR